MDIAHTPAEIRTACDRARAAGKRVGFVPTMGALHEGHLALIGEARRRAEFVVVSIFVNPTQFGPNEDFSRYPRSFDSDCARCAEAGADAVFVPVAHAMYAPGDETRVRVGETARHLCGEHRPGHFEGVCTIVAKLFALVGACVAVFGRKDYQQVRVVARMAADLMLPVEVVGLPTVRDRDGLAMSSRNRYLSPADRRRALSLARGLSRAVRLHAGGERRAGALRLAALDEVRSAVDAVEYVAIADPERVVPLADETVVGDRTLLAIAVRIGNTRLIDNVVLGEEPAPIPS